MNTYQAYEVEHPVEIILSLREEPRVAESEEGPIEIDSLTEAFQAVEESTDGIFLWQSDAGGNYTATVIQKEDLEEVTTALKGAGCEIQKMNLNPEPGRYGDGQEPATYLLSQGNLWFFLRE